MAQMITAIYQQGVFRPLEKPELNEGETVRLWLLETDELSAADNSEVILQALMTAGLVSPNLPPTDLQPVSETRRQELSQSLAASGPLSKAIIEDRG